MKLPYVSDDGFGTRARCGLIVLQVDETIEHEFRTILALPGVTFHVTRVPSGFHVTEETLAAMAEQIPAAVRLLPPTAEYDVIAYACTSGTSVIGAENVARAVRTARGVSGPDSLARTKVTDPLTAVIAACQTLQVQRIGFVSPYLANVSIHLRRALEESGVQIVSFGSFEQSEERMVARIAPTSVLDAILQVAHASTCDAVFVSCTNVRTLTVLDRAETELGLPVISSNQALAWHMLRLAGVEDPLPGLGRLFVTPTQGHPSPITPTP